MLGEIDYLFFIIPLFVIFATRLLAGIIVSGIKIYDRLKYGKFEETVREITLYNKILLEIRRSLRDISKEIEKLPVLKLDHDDSDGHIK